MTDYTADSLTPIELLKPIEAFQALEILDSHFEYCHTLQKQEQDVRPSKLASVEMTQRNEHQDNSSILLKDNQERIPKKCTGDMLTENKDPLRSVLAESSNVHELKSKCGCYLTFETTSEGTLFLNWSETDVKDALAFFCPKKSVPKFKFKQNGGKSELIRNLRGGTGKGMKRYFEGWVQFVKLAREYQSEFVVWHAKDVSLFFLNSANTVSHIPTNEPMLCDSIDAIAAIAPDNTSFEGVATMTRDYFAGCGNREGASLIF